MSSETKQNKEGLVRYNQKNGKHYQLQLEQQNNNPPNFSSESLGRQVVKQIRKRVIQRPG